MLSPSTATTSPNAVLMPYFQASSLKQQFAEDVAQARLSGRIDEQEQQWLSLLLDPQPKAPNADPPRIDRLVMDDASTPGTEMALPILISHQMTDDRRVYLSTLLYGVERFDDRQHLLTTMQKRFVAHESVAPIFDYQLVDGDMFEQQMLAILDQQVGLIGGLAKQLEQLPSLSTAVDQTLRNQLKRLLPNTVLEPSTCFLHLVQAGGAASEPLIVGVQSLFDAALDDFCGQALSPGQSRCFLDAQGRVLGQAESQAYKEVLSAVSTALPSCFEQSLDDYWGKTTENDMSRRDMAKRGLAESFRHHLLDCRQRGEIDATEFHCLKALLPPHDALLDPVAGARALAVLTDDDLSFQVIGMFVVKSGSEDASGLLVYCASTGLRRFDNLISLTEYFATAQGRAELLQHVPLDERPLIAGVSLTGVAITPLTQPLFTCLIDSVLALQKRSVNFAITQPCDDLEHAPVAIDDALDVRPLIDKRLMLFSDSNRWLDTRLTVEDIPASTDSSPRTAHQALSRDTADAPALLPFPSWLELLQSLEEHVQRINVSHRGVRECARELLNMQLSLFADDRLDANHVYLQLNDAIVIREGRVNDSSISLIDVLLERITGHRRDQIPLTSQVVVRPATGLPIQVSTTLTPFLVEQLLKRTHAQFPSRYLRRPGEFYTQPLRQKSRQLNADRLSRDILSTLLHVQFDIEERIANIDALTLGMLEQVLNRPERWMRGLLGNDRAEVFTLSLQPQPAKPRVQMSNTFVLQRPHHAGSLLLFWCSLKGLRTFDSIAALEQYINRRLGRPAELEQWLDFLEEGDKAQIRGRLLQHENNHITLRVTRVDDNFIGALQRLEHQRQQTCTEEAFNFAARGQLSGKVFDNLMRFASSGNQFAHLLDRLTIATQRMLFEGALPDWMKAASTADLARYAEILVQYYLTNDPELGFLADIPRLHVYARDRFINQLNKDFVGQSLDPDTIRLRLTRYLPAPVTIGQMPSMIPAVTHISEVSLTDYALNHFSSIHSADLTVISTHNQAVASLLTPAYLRELTRTQDLGSGYRRLLEQKFDEKDPSHALRKKSFFRQMPASILEIAFENKLENLFSERAFDFIQCVIEMPDGVARQPVHGQDISLRPLQLCAAPNTKADTVSGLYVIGPKDLTQGPVVLHALFHKDFNFKEYANQAALLEDIRTDTGLQALILQRVAGDVRQRYDHGGFREPHLPWSTESFSDVPLSSPGPVTLHVEVVQGNVLEYLYLETLTALKAMAKKQTVTTAEADWQSFLYLMTLGAEQILTFLPGKLGVLVAAWQSHSWFKASANAASHRHWGKAFSEFSAALGVLIVSREEQALEDEGLITSDVEEPGSESEAQDQPFSWVNAQLTPELKARLQSFEANDVALKDLLRGELYNLYQATDSHKKYAVVAGKVYEVRQNESMQWRIVAGETYGPNVKLNDLQQWELDLQWGLRGGGGLLTRSKTDEVEEGLDSVLVTEATCMTEIRRLFRDKARRIGQAHLQAKHYLYVGLDNLNGHGPNKVLDARVAKILMDFFGVGTPSPSLIANVKQTLTNVFNAVLDASLSPFSSSRYVVGYNRPGHEGTVAFTIKEDPRQRIFLTERFFNVPTLKLKPVMPGEPGFNLNAHYRGAVLIHEVSHLSNDTHDIAYLEATSPFLDLIADDVAHQVRFIEDSKFTQQYYLSHQTPRNQLFKIFEHGRWRDLNDQDGGAKAFILNTTSSATLEKARDVFFADAEKRSAIMLANADSLTLLATLLGRERFE